MVQLYELPKFIQFYYFHFEIDRNVGTVFFFFLILNLPLFTVITVPYSYLGMISGPR
jgi:hypothetical protein